MSGTPYDVVIVSAGLSGLTVGAELERLGRSTLVLDKQESRPPPNHACVLQAHALEALDDLGVVPELIGSGLMVPVFRIRDSEQTLAEISFQHQSSSYPFAVFCSLDLVEAAILKRFEALGGAIERPCEIVGVKKLGGLIQIHFDSTTVLHAKALVACDGFQSMVRGHTAISINGELVEQQFLVAEVEMQWPIERDEVSLFHSEDGLMVVSPLPDDRYRIVATVPMTADEPALADLENILNSRGPRGVKVQHLLWLSYVKNPKQVASALREDNIFLTGEAAQTHCPAGGQGLTRAVRDGITLANALHEDMQGKPDALNTWEQRLTSITSRIKLTSPLLKQLLDTALDWVGHIPNAAHTLELRLAQLNNR